jgi:hypothetical protein
MRGLASKVRTFILCLSLSLLNYLSFPEGITNGDHFSHVIASSAASAPILTDNLSPRALRAFYFMNERERILMTGRLLHRGNEWVTVER